VPAARLATVVALVALTAFGAPAAARRGAQRHAASARAVAIRIAQPGVEPVTVLLLDGPPTARGSMATFSYPEDGSVATVESVAETAAVDVRHAAAAGVAHLTAVSLFGGEITADAIASSTSASAHAGAATGDSLGTAIENLVVLGQPVQAAPNLEVPLGDWGEAVLLEGQATTGTTFRVASFRQTMTAMTVTLLADHGGLPAGTRIEIGHTEAFARLPLAARRSAAPQSRPASPPAGYQPNPRRPGKADPSSAGISVPRQADRLDQGVPVPPVFLGFDVTLRMTAGRYVFPVFGPAAYGNTFGAPRGDTVWHHGDDVFAPLGSPILAVTDGTVFSVGWNRVGGNRLWLRDRRGDQFYYAHLSAFSPLAANGADVKAGDVLGFVGDSGDAEGTPFHLHFEIHPAALLFLGYDGVVDPTPFLDAWRRLEDIRFPSGTAWAPALAPHSHAPVPGAILIQAKDISSADGLDPGSLQRVLAPASAEGGAAPVASELRSRR
jgi:murein DD-endopeptidase MepM/ murein hydrolase activator NlpD